MPVNICIGVCTGTHLLRFHHQKKTDCFITKYVTFQLITSIAAICAFTSFWISLIFCISHCFGVGGISGRKGLIPGVTGCIAGDSIWLMLGPFRPSAPAMKLVVGVLDGNI